MGEYLDVSLKEIATLRYGISDRDGELLSSIETLGLEELMGEETMSKIQKHRGDGEGKLTVGAELGVNDYGTKASAFCSVSVTCGNNMEDVAAVHDIVHPYVKAQVEHDLIEMETILHRHLGHAEPEKTVEPPKRAKQLTKSAPAPAPADTAKTPKFKR